MKARKSVLVVIVLLFSPSFFFALAQRQLDRTEVLQVLSDLTAQPRDTWIPYGTMEIRHEEYKAPKTTNEGQVRDQIKQQISEYLANPNKREKSEKLQKMRLDAISYNVKYELSNESTMVSNEVVRYDGERYFWDSDVESRTDTVKPGKELNGNIMKEDFQLEYNAKRTIIWNGEKYTIFSPLAKHTLIDTANFIPHGIAGPLRAGITPWGYSYYTYSNLETQDIEGYEETVEGEIQIRLIMNLSQDLQLEFVLDPAKDYAVLSRKRIVNGNLRASIAYSSYSNINDNWVPMLIVEEKFTADTVVLESRDTWEVTNIVVDIPQNNYFDINIPDEAVVEYISPVSPKPISYKNLENSQTESLLAEKLMFDVKNGTMQQNCATAVIEHVAGKLGAQIDENTLGELVTEPDNTTSFYQIKEYLEGLGLYCRAVNTNLEGLQLLSNCEIILHFPAKKHFVVVDSITSDSVNVIDLASRKFYYQIDAGYFQMDWPTGIALLASNQPIEDQFEEVSTQQLQNIIGSSGYTCTDLLQEEDYLLCSPPEPPCGGSYVYWYERWGCESAPSGSCPIDRLPRLSRCICIEDPYDPFVCIVNGQWRHYYMYACD